MTRKQKILIILLLLTLIAFLLRVLPFGYGKSPIAFSDIYHFTQSLTLGKMIFENDFSELKTPAMYPYALSLVFLFFYAVSYPIGILVGLFSSSAEFIKYIMTEMSQLFELSRIIIALLGALIVPLTYLVTKSIINEENEDKKKLVIISSILASILVTFSLLHIHFSKALRPHVAVSFFIFLGFYFYLVLLKRKNLSSYVFLGFFSGLAAGTLQSGFISIMFLILAQFFLAYRDIKKKDGVNKIKKFLPWQFIVGLLVFLLVFAVSYPYVVISPKDSLMLKSGEFNIGLAGNKAGVDLNGFANFRGKGFIEELRGLFFYEPGLMIILLFLLRIYCFLFLKKKNNENGKNINEQKFQRVTSILGAIIFITVYFVLFGLYNKTGYRMLSPLIPFLCVITGVLFFKILNKINKKQGYLITGFIILITIFTIVQSIRLTSLVLRESTEQLAVKWIRENIGPDKIIAIEGHSSVMLLPNQETLRKQAELVGKESIGQRNEFLLSLENKDYPKDASLSVYHLSIFKENNKQISEFLQTKTDYLVLGDYNTDPDIPPASRPGYQYSLNLKKDLVKQFNPFKKNHSGISGFPQFEIRNPIIDLWKYERMGPLIEIYKINR